MFANRQEWVDNGLDLIQNERAATGLDRALVEDQADSVVAWLARYSPRRVTAYFDGDGAMYSFAISGLSTVSPTASWVVGLSTAKVEYPLSQRPPAFLEDNEWMYYPDFQSATHILLIDTTPSSGTDNVGVHFTALHTVSDTATTVPDNEEPAYEYALAAASLRIYAAKYLHTTDSQIDADAIDYKSKYASALAVAKAFEIKASYVLGVDISSEPPAIPAGSTGAGSSGGWMDFDVKSSGMDPIFRTRRQR